MQSYNNGQANWIKLEVYGLHNRDPKIGFNRYDGAKHNQGVSLIDSEGGEVIMLDSKPVREAAKRGRPAFQGPKMQKPAAIKHTAKLRRFDSVGDRKYEKGGYWVILSCGIKSWVTETRKTA